MKGLGALLLGACLAQPLGAANLVNATVTGPANAAAGQVFTLTLVVQNSGPGSLDNVRPSLAVTPSGFQPVLVSGPSPASYASVIGGQSAQFTWTYSGSGCGSAQFQASVAADELGTPVPTAQSNAHQVTLYCTPTPTPTPTPWIVYGTPTPVRGGGSATIPGNIYKPLQGQALQLQAVLPEAAKLSVELYDRLGRRVRRFEQDAGPGAVTLLWDGRSDEGVLVSTGIYAAHFKARGFSRVVKFAVVK